ncbi:MAG: glycosyltransferase [Beijerinckiaceae bacterium]|nr:glycosyltransferase [Beijerinckiaceae bacterium]
MASVVHIVQRMAPGGIETLVLDLALRDPAVRILSLEGTADELVIAWPRLEPVSDRLAALGKPPGIAPALIPKIMRLLRRWDARAIVAHHIGPLVYGGLAARLGRIAIRVHVEHDGWHYRDLSRARLGKVLDILVQPRKVAVSHGTAEQACAALNTDLVEIIPNGVDLARFHPADRAGARARLHLPQDVRMIGTVGRLVHVKGHDILVDASSKLGADTHVAIVGDGEELGTLREKAAALGVSDKIHFLGRHDRPEEVYPAFDLFCLPSRAEGFPRALIEAQACDVPVVASNVGGVREAVCPRTGRLVEAENPSVLAAALDQALAHPPKEHPRDFVDPRFSLDRTVAAYRSLAFG